MKEDFATIEIAKKLKEKGYTGKTTGKHVEKIPGTEREEWDDEEMMYVTVTDVVTYPRTHVYDVLKWLREEKDIHISTTPYIDKDYELKWLYNIIIIKVSNVCTFTERQGRDFTSSDEAVLAGIEYTLDNLI